MLLSSPKASEEYCFDRSFRVFRVSVVSSYHSDRYPFGVKRFVGAELASSARLDPPGFLDLQVVPEMSTRP